MGSNAPTERTSDDPLLGCVLQGRYRIKRQLGQGGMGAVYEGEHLLIGNPVAVKVLHAKHAADPAIIERFRREAQATTLIRHHHIVGVLDLGQLDDGSLYLVMEHLDGRDWSSDLSNEGPQPVAKVVHILSQVCDALGAAHEAGIVHRDIKPDNIFLIRRSGDPNFVKVLDFGISKIREGAGPIEPSKTQTGTAIGTPYYMAPEQVQGKKDIDARTDIYAMGIVLFQALTGQYPFDAETYPMLVMNIVMQPVPQLSAYRPDLPRELQRVLERMVAKDRALRFSSVQDVKTALAPFAQVADRPESALSAPRPPLGIPLESEVRAVSVQPDAMPRRSVSVAALAVGMLGLVLAGAVTGATIALWPESETQRSVAPTVSEEPLRPREPSDRTAMPITVPADPIGAPQAIIPAPPPPASQSATTERDTSADPSTPEPDRATRRMRREVRLHRTPETRPLAPTMPTRPAPTTRSPQRGANDAIILR
jgi:serine/threonine-protein kinase